MSRINLEQLKTFISVVRLGGIRKAALALHVSQPAATARIKNLEEALAVKLFERTASGLKLTKRGEMLLNYAEQFEHLSELVEENISAPEGIENHLRIGASETITQSWLPEFVSALHEKFPKLAIEINVDISVNLRKSLLNREIDLAILLGGVSEYTVDNIELPGVDLAWYVSGKEPAPAGGDADLILTKPIITYSRNTRPYRELKNSLLERIGPGVALFPSSSLSACFRLVEAGLGVAALPEVLGRSFVADGRLRRFDPGWTPNPLMFSVSYRGDPRSHLAEAAAKLALATAQSYDTDQKN